MKNLTQWSSLYSTESKYNIEVYRSITQRLLVVGGIGLVLCLVVVLCFFESNMRLVQNIIVPLLIFILSAFSFFNCKYRAIEPKHFSEKYQFELNESGEMTFDQSKKFSLHINSRVGILGCWLILENASQGKKNIKRLFIFKDAVSSDNYSRLCRTINRNALRKDQSRAI